ncbi:heparinase II/III family protein [Microvirga sp. TS319]|uniref:heparinase II/III domain-containing protein n=1 Tax=Microvirga sp. TS319 TaxID=3241165 RepID=UPI00351A9AA7
MPSPIIFLPIQSSQRDGEAHDAETNQYIISNNNRWSRAVLNFDGVEADTWCEVDFRLAWHPQEENSAAHDFAVVGLDFLTEDGSSIDFAYVPGLARTQVDPHSWYVGIAGYYDRNVTSCRISFGFFVPSPTRRLTVSIRSWRNSHPFTISEPRLLQGKAPRTAGEASLEGIEQASGIGAIRPLNPRRTWRVLDSAPTWLRFAVLPGRCLLIRGQIINESLAPEGVLARIVYRNAKGEELPPPYPELPVAPEVGAFVDIPVHRQARRFTLDLTPPAEATRVEIGFRTWHAETRVELVTPLEVSLEDDLTLEANSGDDQSSAPAFFKRIMEKLGSTTSLGRQMRDGAQLGGLTTAESLATAFTFHDKLAAVQHGKKAAITENGLALGSFPSWPLPDEPQWSEDPFQSPAWRIEFHSLTWLRKLSENRASTGLARAIDLAASWSRTNPWGHPSDPISAHPQALSARAETLLFLLSSIANAPQSTTAGNHLTVLAETVRHAVALAEVLGQNVFSHSTVHLRAACALLALSRAFSRLPLAGYWNSLALVHLSDGFKQLIDENGTFTEQSPHFQLELVSLGLILARHLGEVPEARDFRHDLTDRLRKGLQTLVAVTDPSGSLPPFGDAPHGFHHASWLRRLLSGYGTSLLSDPALATELSYPIGKKVFASTQDGLIAARHYDHDARWSYFCTSLAGRFTERGHHDCTSFVYSTGGSPWIVDPRGSTLHETGTPRQYLTASRAHNVALPDGREQLAGLAWIEAVEELDGASIFHLRSTVYGPLYEHHRVFITLDRLDAIAVLDHFAVQSGPISFEGLLHFDPAIVVAIANAGMGAAYRKNEKLRIIPYRRTGQFSGIGIEIGRNDVPALAQGFVARPSGGLQPANVFRYRFSGQGTVCGGVLLTTSDQAADSLSRLLETDRIKTLLAHLPGESA